mmetsp:Transcript_52641/g.132306  ORF Transcript_52641/g.132306 Transcript_52641/m.132306 type:complete len:119 (-) Transcript_52641:759-1115(-)
MPCMSVIAHTHITHSVSQSTCLHVRPHRPSHGMATTHTEKAITLPASINQRNRPIDRHRRVKREKAIDRENAAPPCDFSLRGGKHSHTHPQAYTDSHTARQKDRRSREGVSPLLHSSR